MDMSEMDAIMAFLKKVNSEVVDVIYVNDGWSWINAGGNYFVGSQLGYPDKTAWMFGNIYIDGYIDAGPTLAQKNEFAISFGNRFKDNVTKVAVEKNIQIGNGLNLVGNGQYCCNSRLYGVGFNYVSVSFNGITPTASLNIGFNGLLYIMR
jgi:hypothetical protein